MPGDDLLTLAQARKLLGVSRPKMVQLITTGALHVEKDPLDARVKAIRRAEVEALLARSSKMQRAA
jgi:helix-turn-helix protein